MSKGFQNKASIAMFCAAPGIHHVLRRLPPHAITLYPPCCVDTLTHSLIHGQHAAGGQRLFHGHQGPRHPTSLPRRIPCCNILSWHQVLRPLRTRHHLCGPQLQVLHPLPRRHVQQEVRRQVPGLQAWVLLCQGRRQMVHQLPPHRR
jgi:hypothetical protein